MSLERLVFTFTAAVVWIAPAHAGEQLKFGPPPDWVQPAAPAAETGKENTLPARILLSDIQVRFERDRQETHSALKIRFQSAEGLQAGNVSLAWRAETDELTVHKVLIRRGSETIDVLAAGQTFTVLRREQNLEMAMLDGVLTATMFPEGLQVGDVLEIASTVVSRDPVLAGHGQFGLGLNFPFDHANIRLQWPVGEPFKLARTADLPEWKRTRADGYETAALTLQGFEPQPTPRLAPMRYAVARVAEASDYGSWAEVAALNVPLYAKAAKIPAQGPLRAEVERIRDAYADPVARAEAALGLVQGKIRYVALAMGPGGLVPADAEQTWARRFGDCKGKTALLLAILGELGIEAEGVLVNTGAGDALPDRLPSLSFDHILVRARIAGREYWLDGTRTGDTSLARLQVPDLGWGLPVKAGAELVRMEPAPLAEPQSDIAIRMDASKGVHAPVPTEIELTLRGDLAFVMNQGFASVSGDARDRALREYWRDRFDFIEPDSVGLAFDEPTGQLRLSLKGRATMEWNDGWYETDETGLAYTADFKREPGPGSDAPYVVGHPVYARTRQTIVLPPGFLAPTGKDQNVDETVAGVEYKRSTRFADNTLTIETAERSVAAEFAAKDAPAFERRLREMAGNGVFLRLPSGYRLSSADQKAIAERGSGNFDDQFLLGRELLGTGKPAEALVHLTRATELQPGNAEVWVVRGMALAQKGSLDEASADFDRAAAIVPRHPYVFSGRGYVPVKRGDFAGAIADFTTAIELGTTTQLEWVMRAGAYLSNGQAALALADARKVLSINPKSVAAQQMLAVAHAELGNHAEAFAAIEALLELNPGGSLTLANASDLLLKLGNDERAKSVLDRLIEKQPSARLYGMRSRARDRADVSGRLSDLDAAIRLDPNDVSNRMERANLQWRSNPAAALSDTAAVIRQDPKQADAYLLRANIFKRMGRKDDALAEAKAIVSALPDESFAHVAAGKIYDGFGMRAEALAAIDRALAIRPQAFVYLNRSEVRDPADRAGRLADIEQALRLEPANSVAIDAKVRLLTDGGDYAAALPVYSAALKAQPNDPDLLSSRGIALARLGRAGEAKADFARARSLVTDALGLNNLCYTKAAANVALETALEECEESLRLAPEEAPTLDSRGAVLLRLGRLDEAIRDFDKALEINPKLANSRYLRAVARSRQGDAAGARADLATVRTEAPQLIAQMERDGFVIAAE